MEGSVPATVKVSANDLNRIKAPSPILKVYTSKGIDVKIDRSEAYLRVPPNLPEQIELYLVTEEETYTLMLVPLPIPAQTILIKGGFPQKATPSEKELPYIEQIKLLLRSPVKGEIPSGYEVREIQDGKEICHYVECSLIPIQEYIGPRLKVSIYLLKNRASQARPFDEEAFGGTGIRAVMIERHRLEPNASTRLFRIEEIAP